MESYRQRPQYSLLYLSVMFVLKEQQLGQALDEESQDLAAFIGNKNKSITTTGIRFRSTYRSAVDA